ncbi:hypothetical protein CTI12_AA420210 [Artemisia annua]|uniref:Uncharacterized protein n=1 Tax=Artemisia annua TaxID=35608 RepID=A0A2U1M308_ARTAN|nr:hypothetical protein CTI12_AA420210 [Artemisia annua]
MSRSGVWMWFLLVVPPQAARTEPTRLVESESTQPSWSLTLWSVFGAYCSPLIGEPRLYWKWEIQSTLQALLEVGNPIYSARFVRFRMGHPKSQKDIGLNFIKAQECADDKFVWTYTSKTFPMVQESRLQKFTLPEPILCVGGFLQVEFLGRIQRKLSDGKYYICVDISEQSNTLLYNDEEFQRCAKIITQGPNAFRDLIMVPLHPSLLKFQRRLDMLKLIAP